MFKKSPFCSEKMKQYTLELDLGIPELNLDIALDLNLYENYFNLSQSLSTESLSNEQNSFD